jgi:hypothetical protein
MTLTINHEVLEAVEEHELQAGFRDLQVFEAFVLIAPA